MTSDDGTWMTVDDIYEYLERKVKRDTIRSWIRKGQLSAYKPSRTILVKRSDLERFLNKSRTKPEDESE